MIYVFTLDSIGLGEDGPTHQPVEHLAALRAMPNMLGISGRPTATETAVAWRAALENKGGPTALILTRQGTPTPGPSSLCAGRWAAVGRLRGQRRPPIPRSSLIGTGSELHLALAAQEQLAGQGVAARVVSHAFLGIVRGSVGRIPGKRFAGGAESSRRCRSGRHFRLGAVRRQGWPGHRPGSFWARRPRRETLYEKFGITAATVTAAALSLLA